MIELSVSLASKGVVKVPGYEQLVRFGYTKNRGVYRLAVTASGEWEGLAIRCFWHVPDGKDPVSSLVVDGYVDVPASVTAQPGSGCVTFEGSDGTKTVTSADLRYRVSANSGTQDGTPTPDAPVPIVSAGESGSVAVKVTGKNLFPVVTNANLSKLNKPDGGVRYGYVFHVPAESRVTISGNADIYINCFVGDFDIKTQTYTQKAQLISEKGGVYATTLQSGWYAVYLTNDYLPTILMKLNDAKIQIEIGTKATAYEPYHEQLLTLQTPTGLPGIPVTSGGNYTDQNGQQWVCDEVDLERGVKVQRVYKVDVDGENIKFEQNGAYANLMKKGLPNALLYGSGQRTYATSTFTNLSWYYNRIYGQFLYLIAADISDQLNESCKKQLGKIYYALATPIETPLTPAEIAAYKALTAYAPDTVVQASDGAGIKLDYQRDVNLVVKNLEDAIASMTTT